MCCTFFYLVKNWCLTPCPKALPFSLVDVVFAPDVSNRVLAALVRLGLIEVHHDKSAPVSLICRCLLLAFVDGAAAFGRRQAQGAGLALFGLLESVVDGVNAAP